METPHTPKLESLLQLAVQLREEAERVEHLEQEMDHRMKCTFQDDMAQFFRDQKEYLSGVATGLSQAATAISKLFTVEEVTSILKSKEST